MSSFVGQYVPALTITNVLIGLGIWWAGIIFLVLCSWNLRMQYKFKRAGLQGPRPIPFLMNLPELLKHGAAFKAWAAWIKTYGECYCAFSGYSPYVMISDPDLAKEVLTKTLVFKDRGPSTIASLSLGRDRAIEKASVVFATGTYWRGLRGSWTGFLMHSQALQKGYFELINVAVDNMMATLQRKEGQVVDCAAAATSLTMDVIGTIGFGVPMSDPLDKSKPSPIIEAAKTFFDVYRLMRHPYSLLLNFFPFLGLPIKVLANIFPFGSLRHLVDSRRLFHSMILRWIAAARKEDADIKAGKIDAKTAATRDDHNIPNAGSFLRALITSVNKETGQAYSDIEVCSQVRTMLLAGYETTSSNIAFTLYLLAKHPEKQRRLQQEIDEVGRAHRPTAEDLGEGGRYPYAAAVISEALRLYPPPVVAGARWCYEDTTLTSSSGKTYRIPSGTAVMINAMVLGRDARYWLRPEEFRPERFIDKAERDQMNPYAYLPFGAGLRVCPGKNLALLEATLAIVRMFAEFSYELAPGMNEDEHGELKIQHGLTMAPAGGVHLKITKRV